MEKVKVVDGLLIGCPSGKEGKERDLLSYVFKGLREGGEPRRMGGDPRISRS